MSLQLIKCLTKLWTVTFLLTLEVSYLIGKVNGDMELPLNIEYETKLIHFKEQYTHAILSLPGRSTRTMYETVYLSAAHLYYDINIVNVKASCSHIGGDQNAPGARFSKFIESIFSLTLRKVTMNELELSKVLLSKCIDVSFGVAEDEHLLVSILLNEFLDVGYFVWE